MEINGTPGPWIDLLDRYRDFSIASGRTARTIELRLYQLNRFARAHPGGPASVRPQEVESRIVV